MLNFSLIFACLIVGLLLRRLSRFPPTAPHTLNAFIIHISLPAVVFTQLCPFLQKPFSILEMLIPISMPWILFGFSLVFFRLLGKKFSWSRGMIGALILTAGLGNTSFVGFPLLEALVGRSAISIGVVLDQLGTFLVLSTLGLVAAVNYSESTAVTPSGHNVLKKVFTFPPFLALLVSFFWVLFGFDQQSIPVQVLERLASTLIPLALVAVGLQLDLSPTSIAKKWVPLTFGLGFKLFISPIIFWILFSGILGIHNSTVHITLLESAMAPMITAAVVANEFDLDGELANLMVGLGIPLSLVSVPIWDFVLTQVISR